MGPSTAMDRRTHLAPLFWSFAVTTLALGLAAPRVAAHDLWIAPSTFRPAVGELVWVGLRIGHPSTGGEPVARDSRRLELFVLRGPQGETPIPGLDGRDPAGWIRPPGPGRYVIALRSHEAVSVLPAAVFESYLHQEGLESVSAERTRRGASDEPGRERYSRALKALLTVGGPRALHPGRPDAEADWPLGLRLELIARADPSKVGAGGSLPVELRFEDRPLAGALIEARPLPSEETVLEEPTETVLTSRTDAQGRATFELPQGGPWLLTAVHMVPAPTSEKEDWESVWTALSFSLGSD